jgi:hypothetical protein
MSNNLEVTMTTHDIGNKISLKDYILAEFMEQVLEGKDIEKQLFDKWNKHNVSVSELLAKIAA